MAGLTRDEAVRKIREAGLRATLPRIAVFRALARSKRPLSHGELVQALGSQMLDQATVYRNLVKLVEVELARVASRVSGVARYEAQEGHADHVHPHFSCRSCGAVECLPEAKLSGDVGRRWKRSVRGCELQLVGDCPKCIDG